MLSFTSEKLCLSVIRFYTLHITSCNLSVIYFIQIERQMFIQKKIINLSTVNVTAGMKIMSFSSKYIGIKYMSLVPK